MANTTDQMRRLTNSVALAGPIAELTYTEGKTKNNNIPYISAEGLIQCGDDPVYGVRFRIFSKAKKADGTDSKNYEDLRKWCKECVPMTKSKDGCTWAELGGALGMNDYVGKDGKLKEKYQYNISFVNPFTEYKAEMTLEGMIQAVTDEVRGEEETPTGRRRIRLVSADFFGNAVDMRHAIVEAENAEGMEAAGYETGALACYNLFLIPNTPVQKAATGGWGQQRVTEGRSYLEYCLRGAGPIIDEDNEKLYIAPSTFKAMMAERKAHLKEVEDAGYQGGNKSDGGSSGSSSSGGFGVQRKAAPVEDFADDEIPF